MRGDEGGDEGGDGVGVWFVREGCVGGLRGCVWCVC